MTILFICLDLRVCSRWLYLDNWYCYLPPAPPPPLDTHPPHHLRPSALPGYSRLIWGPSSWSWRPRPLPSCPPGCPGTLATSSGNRWRPYTKHTGIKKIFLGATDCLLSPCVRYDNVLAKRLSLLGKLVNNHYWSDSVSAPDMIVIWTRAQNLFKSELYIYIN